MRRVVCYHLNACIGNVNHFARGKHMLYDTMLHRRRRHARPDGQGANSAMLMRIMRFIGFIMVVQQRSSAG